MNFKKIFILFFIFILTPVYCLADDILFEENINLNNEEIEVSSNLSTVPTINARHAVVFDRASGTVLFGKAENEKCKMASTTKIMTAIVVIENCSNLDEIITISKKSARNWWL